MDLFFTAIGIALIITAIVNGIYGHIYKVANMPSTPQTRSKIVKDIQDRHGQCDNLTIYDLGAGWGGLCHKLAKYFPAATVIGYEISPIPFIFAYAMSYINIWTTYTIKRQNLFDVDLSQTDIIICYLMPYHMKELEDIVQTRMKSGALIYSQGFEFPNIKPIKKIPTRYSLEDAIYVGLDNFRAVYP